MRKPRRQKKDAFTRLVYSLVICSLIFYQFYPFFSTYADDSTTVADSSQSSGSSSSDTPKASSDSDSGKNDSDSSSSSDKSSNSDSGSSAFGSSAGSLDKSSDSSQSSSDNSNAASSTPAKTGDSSPSAAAADTNNNPSTAAADQSQPADNQTTGDTPTDPAGRPATDTTPAVTPDPTTNAADTDSTTSSDATAGNNNVSDNTGGQSQTADQPAAENAPKTTTTPDPNVTTDASSVIAPTPDPTTVAGKTAAAPDALSAQITALTPANSANGQNGASATGNGTSGDQKTPDDRQNTTAPDSTTCSGNPCQTATIASGDASATADTVNTVNTNIATDNGATDTQTITGNYVGDINLLDVFNALIDKTNQLSTQTTTSLATAVVNNNVAVVNSDTAASANTGDNTVAGNTGGAAITTGDAAANANVINYVNTNITGNTWLFSTINVLGNWTGNLIVPGAGLLTLPTPQDISNSAVTNSNQAIINTLASANADTGNNLISGESGGTIATGSADANTNVVTIANTNIVKNNWFFLLINNMGSWVGQVIDWDNETNTASAAYSYDFGTDPNNVENLPHYFTSVLNHNSANVTTVASANATTGGNTIADASGNGSIQTGNAAARTNVVNLINTNIYGNNWFFSTVNILGTWTGNLQFAYPDLAVSLGSNKDSVQPGDKITYKVTCRNVGKAASGDTYVDLSVPGYLSNTSGSGWELSGLQPGEERSFNATFKLNSDVSKAVSDIPVEADVNTSTVEKNLDNNTASVDSNIDFPSGDLQITRSDKHLGPIQAGNVIYHEITVKNTGDTKLHDLDVKETIKDPSGNKVAEYSWPISELKEGQHATITYSVSFGTDVALGDYDHTAKATAKDKYDSEKDDSASADIQIVATLASARSGGAIGNIDSQIIAPAEAATTGPEVLGADIANLVGLPLWIWIMAILAYFLAINWAFFPKKVKINNK